MRKRLCILATLVLIIAVLLVACNKSESIICGNCSTTNPKDSQFCSNCGTAFFQNGTQEPSEETQSTAPTENTESSTEESIPQNTEPAPTQPAPTQPAPTQPTPTQPTHTHSYSAATCTSPKNCSCGATSGSALGHSWKNATCTSPKTCSRCGTTSGSAAGHSYTKKVTAATCTAQGYTTYTCSACGDSYKDNYTDASHTFKDYKCTACGGIDKSHSYEYLTAWVKRNGTADGAYVDYKDIYDDVTFSLTYSANYDCLYVSRYNWLDGTFGDTILYLDDYYYCTYFGELKITGYVSAKSFTSNSALAYNSYNGPEDAKFTMSELARVSVCDILDWLEWFLDAYDVGITIADLGFTAY